MQVDRVRTAGARLMSTGVPGPGWYRILTGVVLLLLACLLGSGVEDPAAPFVAVGLAVVGVQQLGAGMGSVAQRRGRPVTTARRRRPRRSHP